ncbi:MAG TPA: dipeptide/oligopeptide/nickel ABC transporter ATP-binding protein, partial [Clostridia bacterium]|nr:dipeptide/oligopeptide/nickel ABC transporter ATP-binding protein [Clostridia bacterium]
MPDKPILEAKSISKFFSSGFDTRRVQALKRMSLSLYNGETLGLMGPSGCGKSTLARILLRLIREDCGSVYFCGEDITHLKENALHNFRRNVQLISQRPEGFFDPRIRIGKSLLEPLNFYPELKSSKRSIRLEPLLQQLSLPKVLLDRFPHQVSGGEIQRLSLCRALLLQPTVLILDEATSMMDISVQAQIFHILGQVKAQYKLSLLFITHDQEVAKYFCNRIVTMSGIEYN